MPPQQIVSASIAAKRRHSDGGVNVIKRFHRNVRVQDFIKCGNSTRKKRTEDGNIHVSQFLHNCGKDLLPIFKDLERAIGRLRQVSIVFVPLSIMLKKNHTMLSAVKSAAKCAERGCVAVAPGG